MFILISAALKKCVHGSIYENRAKLSSDIFGTVTTDRFVSHTLFLSYFTGLHLREFHKLSASLAVSYHLLQPAVTLRLNPLTGKDIGDGHTDSNTENNQ
jgi:hypothetical protein